MSKTLQKVFKLLKNGGDSNDGVSKNLKIDNEKKKLIDKLRTIRKSSFMAFNLEKCWLPFKYTITQYYEKD